MPNGKKVKAVISFGEIIKIERGNGTTEEIDMNTEQEQIKVPEHSIKSPFMPHKDLLNAMKALTKYGMDLLGIEEKNGECLAVGVVIDGDIVLKQSRATIVMTITSPYGGEKAKVVKFPTGPVTMYGDSEYDEAPALAKAIEKVLDEGAQYLAGKYGEVDDGQLSLFERVNLVMNHEEKGEPVLAGEGSGE